MSDDSSRVCSKCRQNLPATTVYFSRSARHKTGLLPYCKTCSQQCAKARYQASEVLRVKARARSASWQKDHPDRHNSRSSQSAKKRKEKHGESVYRWRANNHEKVASYEKAYREKHREAIRAKVARQSAQRHNAPGTFTGEHVREQLKAQRYCCFWCAEPLAKYHIDHRIPLSKGGTNYPSNIVCSCPACNLRKGALLPDAFNTKLRRIKNG